MMAALVLFVMNAVLVWIVTAPRSVDAITPYIEQVLTPPNSGYRVNIEDTILLWDGWQHPFGLHVKNVTVFHNNAPIAMFPDVGVHFYLLKLLIGRIDLKSLELINPTVLLVQGDDGSLSFEFTRSDAKPDNDAATSSLSTALAAFTADESDNPITHLNSFIIRHAILSIKKAHAPAYLQSADASLEVVRKQGSAKGTLTLPLQFGAKRGELDTDFRLNKEKKTVTAEIVYTDIPSSVLHELFPAQGWMDAIHMPLSGWGNVTADFDANIDRLEFLAEAGPGTIDYPAEFEAPLQLQRIEVEGALSDKLNTLTLKKGLLDFKTLKLAFSGTAHKVGSDYGVDATIQTANIPIDNVHSYWPRSLSSHTRNWVITHAHKGIIHKASVALHFKPGEMKLKDTPDAAIAATIEVSGASMKYMPDHPPVTDVSGTAIFTGQTMDAKVTHARYMSGTHISSAHLRFPNLNEADVRLFMDLNLETPARDAAEFLALPPLDKAKKLHINPDATGMISGNAKVDFVAFSEHESKSAGHINYAVNANLSDVSQKEFLDKYDIAHANMKLSLNNKGLKAEGEAVVNQLPMAIDLTTNFTPGNETRYAVKVDMPIARLPDFGLPALDFAKGNMGVNADFVSSDTVEKADADLDVTRASLSFPDYGFVKKTGDQATLKLATEKLPSGNTLISSMALNGPDMVVVGKGEIEKNSGDIRSLTFSKLRYGEQNLDYLAYEKTARGIEFAAKGSALDVSPYPIKRKGSMTEQHFTLDIKADRLILGPNREVKAASVKADCSEECHQLSINVKLPGGTPFSYSIAGGKLDAACDNAGELLRVLGIFDSIEGGKMTMKGTDTGGHLEGQVLASDFTLKKAPVLTKIFTIASLTGILDTLSGNGIYFSKLSAPFTYAHQTILLKEAKAHGSALGVTADGTINTGSSMLDLKGVLVPSYTINSLVGNVPLIGEMLMGGTGKGLIALNYSILGAMNDPSISVNPLSVLTPGFLRGVFNIFDKPAPDLDKIQSQAVQNKESKKTPTK